MEMPVPNAGGPKTRDKNKTTRPGVNAGLDKKFRRTATEMQPVRADETTAKAKSKLEQKKKEQRLIALEDKQRLEDRARTETANHPPDRPLKSPTVETVVAGKLHSFLGFI